MTSLFWVGGTASWNGTAGTKWSTTSGGASGAAAPTAADDVFFDALSTGTCTVATGAVCRSLDCNGFTGTINHTASFTLSIGDSIAGTGNIALRLSTGMTYTLSSTSTSAISFISTSTTVQTITSGGKALGNWTVNGAGSKYQLADANNTSSTALVTLTSGQLDTNSQACSWGLFNASGATVRTLTLGSSQITITGTVTTWNTSTSTNLTFNSGTSVITFTGTGIVFSPGGIIFNNLVFNGNSSSGGPTLANTFTCNNLTRTGTAVRTDIMTANVIFTVTGTLTLTGNSTINRLLFQSNTIGTSRTITAAIVVISNVDFIDIVGAGTATPFTGTSLGDALGNSGITFDTSVTQTHTASAGGNWSDSTKWTSRVPLPQDDVIVNINTTGTLIADMPRLGKSIDFTGFVGTASLSSTPNSFYGSLTLVSGMIFTASQTVTVAGRSTHTLTNAGKTFAGGITFSAPSGTYTLQDALISSFAVNLVAGTLNTNGIDVTAGTVFQSVGTITRALTLGSSTINLTAVSASTIWNFAATGLTFSGASSTIVISTASGNIRTFTGASQTYGTLTYTVANSPGSLTIAGANTFNTLNVGSGRILTMTSSTVTTISSGGSFNVNGTNNGYLYLPGVAVNYVSAPDTPALSITSDITIDCRVALASWTVQQEFVAKFQASGQWSYDFWIDVSGKLNFRTSSDGTALLNNISTAAVGLAANAIKWIRASLQLSDGAGNRVCKFYMSDDGVTWVQLGSTLTTAGVAAIKDSTSILEIGSNSAGTIGSSAVGNFYRAKIYNSYLQNSSGTPVFDADFTNKTVGVNSFVESSTNSATVTINGSLAQAGDGRVILNSSTPGTAATLSKSSGTVTSNYLTIQDSTASGGASWIMGPQTISISNNTGWAYPIAVLTGSSAAVALLLANISASNQLLINSNSLSTLIGSISATNNIISLSNGLSSVIGLISAISRLTSSSDSTGILLGNIIATSNMMSLSDSLGILSGSISATSKLLSLSDSAGILSTNISVFNQLISDSNGLGSLIGLLTSTSKLLSLTNSLGILSGNIAAINNIISSSDGLGILLGNISAISKIFSSSDSLSSLIGSISAISFLDSITLGQSDSSGNIFTLADLYSNITSLSDTSGELSSYSILYGLTLASSIFDGNLSVTPYLIGNTFNTSGILAILGIDGAKLDAAAQALGLSSGMIFALAVGRIYLSMMNRKIDNSGITNQTLNQLTMSHD